MRQLENAIFRAVVLAERDELGINEFPQIAVQTRLHEETDPPLVAGVSIVPEGATPLTVSGPSLRLTDPRGDVRPLEELERDTIRFAIEHYRGQMSEVARRLQIGRSTLYRKLEGLGLDANLATEVTEHADG